MSIGTFGSFTQARLSIYAAQTGLSVTGNNIANINTEGYTRQRLEQTSFYAGGADRYYSTNDKRVGNGVLCRSISQFRDPYLDIRYRAEAASVGALDTKLAGLEDVQRILDEVGDGKDGFGVLGAQFDDFFKQLQHLSDQTGHGEYDVQVRSSATALVKLFNSYASQLEKARLNAEDDFQQDIKAVNTLLTNIQNLNINIRKAELHGDKALELQDERNMLIDKLAGYMKIDVLPKEVDLGGMKVTELTIRLADMSPDPNKGMLIDGIYATQLSVPEEITRDGAQVDNDNYTIVLGSLKDTQGRIMTGSTDRQLADNDLYGSLQAQRELLTEKGEFSTAEDIALDSEAATKRGIPYYQKSLDLLAKQFAETFNKANQGYQYNQDGFYVDDKGNPIVVGPNQEKLSKNGASDKFIAALKDEPKYNVAFDPDGKFKLDEFMKLYKVPNQDGTVTEVTKRGFNMFSVTSSGNDITDAEGYGINASNISISAEWSAGNSIVTSFLRPTGMDVGSTDSSNIIHMLALMGTKQDYTPEGGKVPMFNGTFSEMWNNMGSVLGNDMMISSTLLDTYYASSVQLDTSRDSVSSVDLNDEAMNLMQYSKSYNAACRLMTTLDSVLDKLINGTGMTT